MRIERKAQLISPSNAVSSDPFNMAHPSLKTHDNFWVINGKNVNEMLDDAGSSTLLSMLVVF